MIYFIALKDQFFIKSVINKTTVLNSLASLTNKKRYFYGIYQRRT